MSVPYAGGYLGLGNSFTSQNRPGVGGWVELGRTTLGSSNDTINVGSLDDKRYYMVLGNQFSTGGAVDPNMRLNSDTGSNYADRGSVDGGADATNVSNNKIRLWNNATTLPMFQVSYLANLTAKEKLVLSHGAFQNTAGAATAPSRYEAVGKHAQTSNPISAISMFNNNAGDYDTGSEVVVLGWDPADTHTTNFWEELADVTAGSSVDSFNTGTFTAKKYLWVQVFMKATGGSLNTEIQVGNSTIDTGTNYATRRSSDGGADATAVSGTYWESAPTLAAANNIGFQNIFIVNNAANEKLATGRSMDNETAGAGTAPVRREWVGKWANTSNQIDIIGLLSVGDSGQFESASRIKVWGSD